MLPSFLTHYRWFRDTDLRFIQRRRTVLFLRNITAFTAGYNAIPVKASTFRKIGGVRVGRSTVGRQLLGTRQVGPARVVGSRLGFVRLIARALGSSFEHVFRRGVLVLWLLFSRWRIQWWSFWRRKYRKTVFRKNRRYRTVSLRSPRSTRLNVNPGV